MKPSLLQTIGQPLSIHAELVNAGLASDRALELITNPDLSFKPKYMSLTQTFRQQLATIAKSIDININALLGMLTVNQIEQAISVHSGIKWVDPDDHSGEQSLSLIGITQDDHKKWWFEFEYAVFADPLTYELHDLNMDDILNFMETLENIVSPLPARNEFA